MSAPDPAADVHELTDRLERILGGEARATLLDSLMESAATPDRLRRLRHVMATHAVEGRKGPLAALVRRLDARTWQDGFRVLHSWDHTKHVFTDDIVPALLIGFFEDAQTRPTDDRVTLAILLDYYFVHLLSLAAMRAWDTADPDAHLRRVTELLATLQGERGSGHVFVRDAETLVIYALSQFHPEEQAYDRIIERIGRLDTAHQLTFARASAAVLSAHLRWGFWVMYERDVSRMRADNAGDYPWLLHTAHTLMRAYVEGTPEDASRTAVCSALLLALSADPWVFRARCPAVLEGYASMHAETRAMLESHGSALMAEWSALEPGRDGYSPLGLLFNFPHNALVGIVTMAMLESRPQSIPINALFEEEADAGVPAGTQRALAERLMEFSEASPERLGYRGARLIVYDALSGMRSYSLTVDTLTKSLS